MLVVTLLVLLTAAVAVRRTSHVIPEEDQTPGTATAALSQTALREPVDAQTHATVAAPQANRLGRGLIPPTNRWFSGLVFGPTAQPVFPLPLVFTMRSQGFGMGIPAATPAPGAFSATVATPVAATVAGGAHQLVTAYDDASVTLTVFDSDWQPLGKTIVTEGIPSVTFLALRSTVVTLGGQWEAAGPGTAVMTQHPAFGVRSFGAATVAGGNVTLEPGAAAVVYAAPTGSDARQYASSAVPVTATTSRYWVEADSVTTEITYRTLGSADTAIVTLPTHTNATAPATTLPGTFDTVYGRLPVHRGTTLRWRTPRLGATMGLDISALTDDQRQLLRRQVAADIARPVAAAKDTYFAGKDLFRLAQLADLAHQLGAAQAAADATSRLRTTLLTWSEQDGCRTRHSECFVWDPQWKGVVGEQPSFGTERFSDHHFHYGYFLYAAAILAKYDPGSIPKLKPTMTLLAADLASPVATAYFPRLRGFDVFAGHSWASGTGQFTDGNDQESSSEAMNAWAGLQLWARAVGDHALGDQASWMLSLEAAAARAYWLDPAATLPAAYGHRIVGINFGNKRVYGTWFSQDPASILGIQLIPFSPAIAANLSEVSRTQILQSAAEAVPDSNYNKALADYVLMYKALASATAASEALPVAERIDDARIDSASSKTYLMAYLMLRADQR